MSNCGFLKKAEGIYEELCKKVIDNEWSHQIDEERRIITFSVDGKDMVMRFRIRVDAENQLIKLISIIPLSISEEKRGEIAYAICAVNNKIIDGNFDFNPETGNLFFRMTNSFRDTELRTDVLEYLIECSVCVVDKYDTLLKGLASGALTLDEFFNLAFEEESADNDTTKERYETAKKVFEQIYKYVEKQNCDIKVYDEFGLSFCLSGNDLSIPIIIGVDPYRQLIKLHSPMPFSISKKSSLDCAIAVCMANFGMDDGCFEFDSEDGFLEFRTEISYSKCEIGEELLSYMIEEAKKVVDRYNDKFLIFAN